MTTELTPTHIDELVRGVDGWFGGREGRLLYRLAASADPAGAIVEIGSWQGRSTIWLAAGACAGRGARVVAIDPHRGTSLRTGEESTEAALRANLDSAGLAGAVEVVVATSEEAVEGWTRPVSLLWIDGDHSYEGALRDLDLWEPHLADGAAVAFHDTFVWRGPERVFRERIAGSRDYTGFEWAETTSAARRCGRLSWREDVARRTAVARRAAYGIRLRAYDGNMLGYARLRDVLTNRRSETLK
jgi:predicted O-methyltransferase YrrM